MTSGAKNKKMGRDVDILMYRVVLVEDEPIVRIGLKNMIDWNKYNMTVIGDYSNGKEAIEVCLSEKPEVLITDIRMPIMNGLELIREVRKTNKRMVITILSCLDEFSYAQEATSLGVSNYILKLTCGLEELDRVLLHTKEELDSRFGKTISNPVIDNSLMKEQVFFDFVQYDLLPAEAFFNAMNQLGMYFLTDNLYLLLINLKGYERFLDEDQSGRRLRRLLRGVISEELKSKKYIDKFEIFCNHSGEFTVLLANSGQMEDDEEGLKDIFLSLSLTIDKRLNLEASFQISDIINNYKNLPDAYKEVKALSKEHHNTYPKKIREALNYIVYNYQSPISLQDAADHLQISAGYLSRLFVNVLEVSFTDTLNQQRIRKAKRLLDTTDIPVYTIGEIIGIPNTTYFIRVFKKHEGITPNEYRLRDER